MVGTFEEHLQYLTAKGRHALFAKAITQTLGPGNRVADLGCGFGVLGLQCLSAGAAKVYGIDHSDAIEIARETVRREGLAEQYECIRSTSFRAELPEKVDFLICDHIGFFGIDYGIIAMMQDARRRMLEPEGKVMPQRIDLKIAGVSSGECRAQVTAWSRDPVPHEYAWLETYAANMRHDVELGPADLCSAAEALGTVRLDADNPDIIAFETDIVISQDGDLHGIAGWFDCELADGVWMTNSPLDENSIGRSQAFFPLAEPMAVRTGDRVAVDFRINHALQILTWTIAPEDGAEPQSMSTWKSTILTPADLAGATGAPLSTNSLGRARKALLDLLDGTCSSEDIEQALLALEPPVFPSTEAVRQFVKAELKIVAE